MNTPKINEGSRVSTTHTAVMGIIDQPGGHPVVDSDADRALVRAIGQELRRARGAAGWSRPELIKRMTTRIPVNTYACYEQGIRACSIPRLVEICHTLGVGAPDLLGLALQRLELDVDRSQIQIDLHKIVRDDRAELGALRQWARNRLAHDLLAAESDSSAGSAGAGVVRLPWALAKEIATFCGITEQGLRGYVREFAPESARP